jgi:hypothetical protein
MVFSGMVLIVYLPDSLNAQARGGGAKTATNPVNPAAPPEIPDRVHPTDGWGAPPLVPGAGEGVHAGQELPAEKKAKRKHKLPALRRDPKEPIPSLTPIVLSAKPWYDPWTFSLSALYQFSNQRSRVGSLSWDVNSVGIDFAAALNAASYTWLDISYFYSHLSGSSPTGSSDVTNQHVGAVRILQPLEPAWCPNWKPADQSASPVNQQWAILVTAAYGGSLGSLATPNLAFQHDTTHTLLGNALLDYQLAWFPSRQDSWDSCRSDNCPNDICSPVTYRYPNLVLELSSGAQFETFRFDSSRPSSDTTTSGRQFDYLNTVSISYSFPCRFGFLIAGSWDAPFESQPVRGAKPFRANTVTFIGGLVYNLYPYTKPKDASPLDLRRFTLSLLYSYTAFDPLTETNALQFQISYSF